MKNLRQSNFELLRIICMFFIVINHYISWDGIVESYIVFNFNNNIAHFLRSSGHPCLTTFVMISGFFMVGSKFKTQKIISICIQVTLIALICLGIAVAAKIPFSKKDMILSFAPYLSANTNWFVGIYIGMCLLSPFANILIKNITRNQYNILLLFSIIMYFVIPTLYFFNGFAPAPNVLTFIIIYFVAGYIKIYDIPFSRKKLIIILCITWLTSYLVYPLGYLIGKDIYTPMVTNMNNIFSFVIGVSLFLIFKKTNIKSNAFINYIANATFGIYLFHDNFILRQKIWELSNRIMYYDSNWFIIHLLTCSIILFVVCLVLDKICQSLLSFIMRRKIIIKICNKNDEFIREIA